MPRSKVNKIVISLQTLVAPPVGASSRYFGTGLDTLERDNLSEQSREAKATSWVQYS